MGTSFPSSRAPASIGEAGVNAFGAPRAAVPQARFGFKPSRQWGWLEWLETTIISNKNWLLNVVRDGLKWFKSKPMVVLRIETIQFLE